MISRHVFAAAALLCALVVPAQAQKTKAQLNTEIGVQFPDNSSFAIAPLNLRTVTADIVNAILPTAPVVTGNLACFNGTTGLLQDCGVAPGGVGLSVGVSLIAAGTTTRVLFDNAGVLGEYTISGSGSVCMNVSCSMTTPALGTPSSGVATNLTGTAAGLTAGNVTTNANMTGDVTSVGNATTIAANAVTFAKFQQIAALSLFGNCTNALANGGAVTGIANQILRVNGAGTSCGFGFIDLSQAASVGSSILALGNGGCNALLTASNGGILYSTASACSILAGTATARLPLLSGASTTPQWGAYTLPASVTSGGVACFTSTTVEASSVLLTANGVMYGGGAGVCPSAATAGTNGQFLLGVTGSPPQMVTMSQDCTVTNAGVITCTKTNNVAFGPFATQTAPCGVAQGCTGQTTAPTARASSGLNVDQFTGHGDSIYTILATDRTVGTNAAFTASRTWTLPAANAVNAGQEIVVADFQGTVTGVNTLVISRAGADTINGGTSVTMTSANGAYLLKSDGTSKWTAQALGAAAGGGVSSVTCGTGLSGGTITTSGTCAVNLTTAANALGADVGISNSVFTDGPSMAQGTSGTWAVSGTITFSDTAGAVQVSCELWDGTTVIDSGRTTANVATSNYVISLSGTIVSPAANIRMSCTSNAGGATTSFRFNASGKSNDSKVSGFRIG